METSKIMRAGLIGSGIQASLTPAMHMAEARSQGFAYRYDLLDLDLLGGGTERLSALIKRAEADGFVGLNITHPCKQAVIPLLDTLSEDAATLGAVNTVVLRDGKRHGHNTDWWGFAEAFRRRLPDAELRHVVQLGAGGAGAATVYAILMLGADAMTIFDPDGGRAAVLVAAMKKRFPSARISAGSDLAAAMADASGLIHATPTGMANYPGLPLDADLLNARQWVAEIVYFPLETELLAEARRRGCRVVDGGGMAVFQAVGAFGLFTGCEADAGRMMRHFMALTGTGEAGDIRPGAVG
ncbi:shikimate dehydrogenase [Rhizobium sp. Root482]|uniref:shikimate dehydrogenase n=1 Tax=Rhizobium sp. Root482 TaxID=1736543 RepID=UPI000701D202|nr:shikimate dehydrogenase [Rhizobium sp. Root482]KQY11515.1 shikimate dehydrogenase [Rhizobium sp. Root482]